jgi:hypothetical protein
MFNQSHHVSVHRSAPVCGRKDLNELLPQNTVTGSCCQQEKPALVDLQSVSCVGGELRIALDEKSFCP